MVAGCALGIITQPLVLGKLSSVRWKNDAQYELDFQRNQA